MATIDRKGKSPSNAAHHLSAGALSGFTSAIILQPLDLLKTRLQQDSHEVVG
jgi:solute carrier family 25 protein 38